MTMPKQLTSINEITSDTVFELIEDLMIDDLGWRPDCNETPSMQGLDIGR